MGTMTTAMVDVAQGRRPDLTLNPRQSSNEGHSVVPFRRRRRTTNGSARPREINLKQGANVTVLLSLAKYESDDEEDHYRHRMLANVLAFIVTVALIAIGVWLASNLHD
jgi:hypothetical protein